MNPLRAAVQYSGRNDVLSADRRLASCAFSTVGLRGVILVINSFKKHGSLVGAVKGRLVGPNVCNVGVGARCVRRSAFARSGPPKIGVGEGFRPVPEIGHDDGVNPPKLTPGMGQNGVG